MAGQPEPKGSTAIADAIGKLELEKITGPGRGEAASVRIDSLWQNQVRKNVQTPPGRASSQCRQAS